MWTGVKSPLVLILKKRPGPVSPSMLEEMPSEAIPYRLPSVASTRPTSDSPTVGLEFVVVVFVAGKS
jgi:hypothetical protein